jgi:hypothetical protein
MRPSLQDNREKEMSKPSSLLVQILETSARIKNHRNPQDVLMTVVEEVGELATEIAIISGHKNREPGDDGILGETIDVICAAVDILHLLLGKDNGDGTHVLSPTQIEYVVMKVAESKLKKWEDNVEKE